MIQKGKKYQPISADIGHSNAKIVAESGQVLFPTMASEGPITRGVNGVFDQNVSRKPIDTMAISTKNTIWYIGNIAKRSQRTPMAPSGTAKYTHPNFLNLMLLAALSEVKTTDTPVVLVTALPGKFYQDDDLKKTIRQQFIGYHSVQRVKSKGAREEKMVEVADVQIKSETGGLLFSHILTPDGQIVKENFFNDMVSVTVDIGAFSTCLKISRGLESMGDTQANHSFTDVSMGRIYGAVAGQVEADTRHSLLPWQVGDIIINGDGTIPLNVKGHMVRFDLMPIYQSEIAIARGILLTKVSQTVADVVDEDNVDLYLVGGGGASQIGGIIKDTYTHKVKICNQFSTAQGLFNFGERLCQKNLTR